MFSPSELEGEVDHSFFDSDCDDNSASKDEGEKKSTPAHTSLHANKTENTNIDLSPKTDETRKLIKPVDNNSSSIAERKENSCQSKEEERSRSSVSFVTCTSDKVFNNSSHSEKDINSVSEGPDGTSMTLMAEGREVDCKNVYNQSPKEEKALPSTHSGSKGRNKQSPKEMIGNQHTQSPYATSNDCSFDADSESSSRSSSGRSSSNSSNLPRPNKLSLSPGVRRTQVGSAGSQDVPIGRAEESEDTVTDVSPLSSPDISPLQSLDLNHTDAEEGSFKEQQQESVPSSGLSNMHQDVDEGTLRSESQLGGNLVFNCPYGRNRKNFSFTNDEVKRIDRENQRLLRELSRPSPGPRAGSTVKKRTPTASKSPQVRLSHSALNRQREQQRIERENLAFLKRLDSTKPTPGLKRSEQLEDYQRYVGSPSFPN
ncbi:cilia- and flagella-associated protein 97 isoform X2 [Cottoperca gobio]|nr:cilia- and flagella-associated protein 97 isoform X2 [Cottoperca gobio]